MVMVIIRYRSNRGVSFSFRRVPQIWRSQSGYVSIAVFSRDHLFRLSPAATQTRGRGIPLYRPAGLWHPVGDPSHVLWDVAAPSDDPGELRNIQKNLPNLDDSDDRKTTRLQGVIFSIAVD